LEGVVGKIGPLLPLLGIAVHSSSDPGVRAGWLLRWAEEIDSESEERRLAGDRALGEGLLGLTAARAAGTLSPETIASTAIRISEHAGRRGSKQLHLEGLDLAIAAAETEGKSSELARWWHAKGECLEEAGSARDAVECYRSAVAASPRGEDPGLDLEIIGALLDTERALDEMDRCAELLGRAAEVVAEAAVSASVGIQEFVEGALEIARLALIAGNREVALDCYERVREQLVLDKDLLRLGALWHEVAGVCAAAGEGEQAISAYERAYKYKAQVADIESQVETLLDLAEAELRWSGEEELERTQELLIAALGKERSRHSRGAELDPLLAKTGEKLLSSGQADAAARVRALGEDTAEPRPEEPEGA
jgi:tetratricopeptide (TPR) repeat protein